MNSCIKYLVESFIDDEDEIIDVDINFNREDFIDLGLPSGTLWSKCNLGAKSPEEYGLYYLWGSLEGHVPSTFWFNKDNYNKQYNKDYYGLEKLREEDDAAFVESNGLARIPTKEQWQELIDNCDYKKTNLNGVNVALFTGPNRNTIIIPASGWCSALSVNNVGYHVSVWSQTLCPDDPQNAYYIYCISNGAYINGEHRFHGLPIRAVLNKNN